MCNLCDEESGMQSCQDCGRLICFDVKCADDICAPAYVTSSGDVYCRRCGTRADREEERLLEEESEPLEFDDAGYPIDD